MIVAHNMMAMNAQRQFNIVGNAKKKSMEKLSSGYKVNRAADDAAGLSISEKMRKQIRGLQQGANNVQDGISLLQVADGALSEVQDMLHRVTELSVKSANGTNSASDREAIQQEIDALLKEINRISDTTKFNERTLFQGATGKTVIPAVYAPATASNFRVTGTPTNNVVKRTDIEADLSGVRLDGIDYDWLQFSDGAGHTLADGIITAGTYTIVHNGMTLSIDVEDNAALRDVSQLLDGASYTTKVVSYEERILSDIFQTLSVSGTTRGYKSIDNPCFEKTGDILLFKPGMLDENENEIVYRCNLASTAWIDNSMGGISTVKAWGSLPILPFRTSSTSTQIEFLFRRENASGSDDLTVFLQPLEDSSFAELFAGLENCDFIYTETVDDNEKELVTTFSGAEYRLISDTTVELLGAGYDWFDLKSGIDFEKQDIGGIDAFVSDNNNLILYKKSGSDTEYETPSGETRLSVPEDADSLRFHLDSNEPWFRRDMGTIRFSDIPVATGIVAGLDSYDDSGFHSSLVTPEQIIHSHEDLDLWIQSGAEAKDGMHIIIEQMDADLLGLTGLDVSTIEGAEVAITAGGNAIEKISNIRSRIGAQQNRLEHTYNNINNIAENTMASESRIRDTNMAKEMTELAKQNILEQAGTAIMSQANQSNQGVLTLLNM